MFKEAYHKSQIFALTTLQENADDIKTFPKFVILSSTSSASSTTSGNKIKFLKR
jgi:hypothetical protein